MKLRISILWLTLVVVALALVISQLIAIALTREYVNKPRTERGVNYFVNHLKTIGAALDVMPPDEEEVFMKRIRELEGVEIAHATEGPEKMGMTRAPDRPQQTLFRQRIREAFGSDSEIYVRNKDRGEKSGAPRMLWVLLRLEADEHYWVGFPRTRIESMSLTAITLWSAAGLLIALLAAVFIMWRLNLPLLALSKAARELGEGRDPGPVTPSGPSELRDMAQAFNHMNDSLKAIQRDRATFLAGISHDLRTPLSHLRLDLEIHRDKLDAEAQAGMVADLESMDAILEQFLGYAQGEAGETVALGDLSGLVEDTLGRWSRTSGKIHANLSEVPMFWFRPLAMRRLLDNLLSNAERHAGGDIEVSTGASDGNAVISVLDRGPGISPDQAERLKQPFTRKDDGRNPSGAGLGLAIADRVARLHRGRLDLLPRDGGGLEARVTLPLAVPA
jgi:two-component system osmolarity sensor histidine kinase EnvZ